MKTITICADASCFEECVPAAVELKKPSFKRLPVTAKKMRREGGYEVSGHKSWLADGVGIEKKTGLIKRHFREIELGDLDRSPLLHYI